MNFEEYIKETTNKIINGELLPVYDVRAAKLIILELEKHDHKGVIISGYEPVYLGIVK